MPAHLTRPSGHFRLQILGQGLGIRGRGSWFGPKSETGYDHGTRFIMMNHEPQAPSRQPLAVGRLPQLLRLHHLQGLGVTAARPEEVDPRGDVGADSVSGKDPHPLAGEVVERKSLALVTGNRSEGPEGIGGYRVSMSFRPFDLLFFRDP